jgi:predicted Fe-Mo cluster-binding NifX family protein
MIIAVALTENHLRSLIDVHFGRCDWYGIHNSVTKETTYAENPNRYLEEGAGCKSVDFLKDIHVELVVAGRFGNKVVDLFKKNNIQMVIAGENQTFNQIIQHIKK